MHVLPPLKRISHFNLWVAHLRHIDRAGRGCVVACGLPRHRALRYVVQQLAPMQVTKQPVLPSFYRSTISR